MSGARWYHFLPEHEPHQDWARPGADSSSFQRSWIELGGAARPAFVQVAPLRSAADEVRALFVQVHAEHGRDAAAMRSARERDLSDKIVNAMPGVFFVCDASGRLLRWNRELQAASGHPAGELPRRRVIELVDTAERARMETAIGTAMRLGVAAVELDGFRHEQASRAVLLTLKRIDYEGQPCLIGTGLDITEHRQLEVQLRQLQKMESVGQLAAGIAHDFNNLLTVVQGQAALLLEELPDGDLRELALPIERACERATNLTRKLLQFSRKQRFEMQRVDLRQLVRNLGEMLTRLLPEQFDLVLELAAEELPVSGDPVGLEQVITNLVVNARDAMDAGGQVRIEVRRQEVTAEEAARNPEMREGPCVRLSVRDSGRGMNEQELEHLFEPFFTTKGVGKGTGLGLATAYGIVKQHGGWMVVQSRAGVGTTMQVYLPSLAGAEPIPTSTPSPTLGEAEQHAVVLVVDDEPQVRLLVSHVLRSHGFEVLDAAEGSAAVELWQQHRDRIDAVVSDIVMPGPYDGRALVRRLRQDRDDLPVLYMSGFCADVQAGRKLDGAFLPKPFEPQHLLSALRALLQRR